MVKQLHAIDCLHAIVCNKAMVFDTLAPVAALLMGTILVAIRCCLILVSSR